MTKPEKTPPDTPPGHQSDWIHDPAYELVGFIPCVPLKGPDGDVEEGVLEQGSRRMAGVTLTLQDDETLLVDTPLIGRRQVYPKGMAAFLFQKKTEPPA